MGGIFDSIGGFVSDIGESLGGILDNDIFSTNNILGGLGAFASVLNQNEQAQALAEQSKSKFDQEVFVNNLDHQQAIEILKLQAALRGGGGGGGGVDQAALARYQQMMAAAQMGIEANQVGSANTIQALRNVMEGAQAPILVR